ncbi:MAG: reverse transcriptase-like protein [Clostridia bacterium]|jgi:ribonuclease HI|nr:reverse transcriptase-like protein [Clostridia bacterium]
MKQEKVYEIFTDASFDDEMKIGTYAIVIKQENKIIKAFGKKCRIQLNSATECEIFAIFQVLNLIESNLIERNIIQKFYIRTDCNVAMEIFIKNSKAKVFKNNVTLLKNIKKSYKRVKSRLINKDSYIDVKWIPRKLNKIAHNYSYSVFKKVRSQKKENHSSLLEMKEFMKLLQGNKSKQYMMVVYLVQKSNEEKMILKTQKDMAIALEMSLYSVNKTIRELIRLKVIEKVKNGKYLILI